MIFDFTNAFITPNKRINDPLFGKLTIRVYGTLLPFSADDRVLLRSDRYNGVYKIDEIYKSMSHGRPFFDLRFADLDFKGDGSGTVELVAENDGSGFSELSYDLEPEVYETKDVDEPEFAEKSATIESTRPDVDHILLTAESQAEAATDKIEAAAADVVKQANKLPSRWFYALLLGIALIVFIIFSKE